MKNFIKTVILTTLTSVLFQSCESEETREDIVSDEQRITGVLTEKIVATATSLSDYNFFTSNAAKTDCEFLSVTNGYFANPEGDYFNFSFFGTESFEMWLTQYNEAKLEAINATRIEFSDEDFFISVFGNPSGFGGLVDRESMLNYFEDCMDPNFGNVSENGIPFTDTSLDCDNFSSLVIWIYDDSDVRIDTFETNSLLAVEDLLASYNLENNTNYGLENLRIGFVSYLTPNDDEIFLIETRDLQNFFRDCKISRDASTNDCLNFVFPIEVNRFSLELEEVITKTLENDEDLIETFNTNVGELGFVFPISLQGQDGTIVDITSNEALENALDNAENYCD